MVEQLEESRQRLSRMVDKLEVMRKRDAELNTQLQGNIEQLNQEIIEREKAESAHLELLEQLKQEMKTPRANTN
ncbi:Aerobic respiration control sensor protein ArcB [Providencia stuartii]|nr:Aerobic respiration control sensor protein ArcB [Providencia stuartii]